MNTNAASLDRLHDIVMPGPVPWWPPATGWYWVMAFALVLAVLFAFRGYVRWQHNRYRREALIELTRLEAELKGSEQRTQLLPGLSELLKRTALSAFPRAQIASLIGAPWFAFLDRAGQKIAFSTGLGAMLENAVYDPRNAAALDEQKVHELTAAIRYWIKHHRTDLEQRDAKETKEQSENRSLRHSAPALQKT